MAGKGKFARDGILKNFKSELKSNNTDRSEYFITNDKYAAK